MDRLMNFSKNYLLVSIGLAAVFVMGVIPADISSQVDSKLYGAATITLIDVDGNELFTQTVHNRLLDIGENYLLMGAFNNGTTITDNVSVGAICITDAKLTDVETETAADFDGDNSFTEDNCINGDSIINADGTAIIGALTFEAGTGEDNLPTDGKVAGIGICLDNNGADYNNCANGGGGGILFAQVNTSNVTLASGETVDITYTFDISSDGN